MKEETYYIITYILALPILIIIRTIGFIGSILEDMDDFIENQMCNIRAKGYKKLLEKGVINNDK